MNFSNLKPLDYRKNPFREDHYSVLTIFGIHTVYRHEHDWYFRNPWDTFDQGPYKTMVAAEKAAWIEYVMQVSTLFKDKP